MKQLTIAFVLFLIVSGAKTSFAGGDEFNGIIVYNISYSNSDLDEAMLSQMPKTMKLYVKGKMAKSIIQMGMGTQASIMDGENMTTTSLMDIMGQKFAYTVTKEELMKELEEMPEPDISYPNETKEIAGYTANKVVIETKDPETGEEMIMTGYYTDELGKQNLMIDNPIYKDIEGIMLEFATKAQGMEMEFKAVEVDKKKVSDKEFEVPEGYKEVTKEELENMFGG